MPNGGRANAGTLKPFQFDISELTDPSKISWDTSPMNEMMWLMALPRLLQQTKSYLELFEFGHVLVQSKTAVESILQARYTVMFPDVTFEWSAPSPATFSIAAYEARRNHLTIQLDRWHATQLAANLPVTEPPFTLASYIPMDERGDDYDPDFIAETAEELGIDPLAPLNEIEKLRFVVSPEMIAAADRAAGIAISDTISDNHFARQLLARHGRSGRTLMRREYISCRANLPCIHPRGCRSARSLRPW